MTASQQFLLTMVTVLSVLAVMLVLVLRTPPKQLPMLTHAFADVLRALNPFASWRR